MSRKPNVKKNYVQISSFEKLIVGLLAASPAASGDINFWAKAAKFCGGGLAAASGY